jgi:hypothetical protein
MSPTHDGSTLHLDLSSTVWYNEDRTRLLRGTASVRDCDPVYKESPSLNDFDLLLRIEGGIWQNSICRSCSSCFFCLSVPRL